MKMIQEIFIGKHHLNFYVDYLNENGSAFTFNDIDVEKSLELRREYKCKPHMCHKNVARIFMTGNTSCKCYTGFIHGGLPHSWMVDENNRLIEPTLIRKKHLSSFDELSYFGLPIDAESYYKMHFVRYLRGEDYLRFYIEYKLGERKL